jgi:hypothetical protein
LSPGYFANGDRRLAVQQPAIQVPRASIKSASLKIGDSVKAELSKEEFDHLFPSHKKASAPN